MPPKRSNNPLLPTDKLPLPEFLRLLNEAGMTTSNSIAVAGKVYKTNHTPEKLGALTASELAKLGVNDKEQRAQLLEAMKRFRGLATGAFIQPTSTGASTSERSTARGQVHDNKGDVEGEKDRMSREEGEKRQEKALDVEQRRQAALTALQEKFGKGGKTSSLSKKRKRGRDDDLLYDDIAPPAAPKYERAHFDFHEVLNEEQLKTRAVVINRAPVMMAWSCVVAEHMGFEREEALSIASAYTEMNAVAKGTSIGVYEKGKEKGMEPGKGTAQPHVELMGRRIPLIQSESGQWRALMKGDPVTPDKPFLYISRSLAQMSPYLLGALTLLARAFDDPQHLNRRAYQLYCDFRPENSGWGVKGEVKLETILRLRDGIRAKEEGEKKEELTTKDEPKEVERKGKEAATAEQTFEEFEALEEEGNFTLWDLYEE